MNPKTIGVIIGCSIALIIVAIDYYFIEHKRNQQKEKEIRNQYVKIKGEIADKFKDGSDNYIVLKDNKNHYESIETNDNAYYNLKIGNHAVFYKHFHFYTNWIWEKEFFIEKEYKIHNYWKSEYPWDYCKGAEE